MISRVAGYLFLLSLFGFIIFWGYAPKLWALGYVKPVLLGLLVLSSLVYFVFNIQNIILWTKKRSTQFGISLAIAAIMVIAILGAVNWFVTTNNKKFDVTQNKLHTLSDQSRNIAKGLKEEVTLTVWSTSLQKMSANLDIKNFLEDYKIASKGKITIEIKNPNEDRAGALQDNVKRDNLIIVRTKTGREARIDNFNDTKGEEQITNAMVQVIKGGGSKKVVCFLSGHGEFDIEDGGQQGLSKIKQRLVDSSYEPKKILLASTEKMPAECESLVIAGPKTNPFDREIDLIKIYLAEGGKVLALFGPGVPEQWNSIPSSFGIKIQKDIILDKRVNPPFFVLTQNYAKDVDIVKSFGLPSMFPEVSSIHVPLTADFEGAKVRTFISTESTSYAKLGELKKLNGQPIAKTRADLGGPFSVAVLVTKDIITSSSATKLSPPPLPSTKRPAVKPTPPPPASPNSGFHKFSLMSEAMAQEDAHDHSEATEEKTPPKNQMNLIVFANNAFVADAIVDKFGNMDLFLNAVNFLMKDSDLIGIRPREIRQASLTLSEEKLRQVWATILLIAGVFLVGGIRAGRRKSMA